MKFKNLKLKIKNYQRGVSLYLAILIMAVLLALALGISAILYGQMKMIKGMKDSVIAFYAANTGVERVLYGISRNQFASTTSGNVGPASYQATLVCGAGYTQCPPPLATSTTCLAPYYCLKSTGIYKDTKRAIHISR